MPADTKKTVLQASKDCWNQYDLRIERIIYVSKTLETTSNKEKAALLCFSKRFLTFNKMPAPIVNIRYTLGMSNFYLFSLTANLQNRWNNDPKYMPKNNKSIFSHLKTWPKMSRKYDQFVITLLSVMAVVNNGPKNPVMLAKVVVSPLTVPE